MARCVRLHPIAIALSFTGLCVNLPAEGQSLPASLVRYRVVPIREGLASGAAAVNDTGQVVGSYSMVFNTEAFVWENGSLVTLPRGTFDNATATDINEAGVIVGQVSESGLFAARSAVRWTNSGGTWSGATLDSGRSAAAIGDQNLIVGTKCNDILCLSHNGFIRYPDDSTVFVPPFADGQDNNNAFGINDLLVGFGGAVVGSGQASDGSNRALFYTLPLFFLFSSVDLGVLPPTGDDVIPQSVAYDLNNQLPPIIVGSSDTGVVGETLPVVWTGAVPSTIRSLGTFGGPRGEALAVNDWGWVVGWAQDAAGEDRAFLVEDVDQPELIDLNDTVPCDTTVTLRFAVDINDEGWIAGTADDNGQDVAFLLIPHPAGDCDDSGTADPNDVAAFSACRTAPGVPVSVECRCFDLDCSGSVDLRDFAFLQRTFGIAFP